MLIQQAFTKILDLIEQNIGSINGRENLDRPIEAMPNDEFNPHTLWTAAMAFLQQKMEDKVSKPTTDDLDVHLQAFADELTALAKRQQSSFIPPTKLDQLIGVVFFNIMQTFKAIHILKSTNIKSFAVIINPGPHVKSGSRGLHGDELRQRLKNMPVTDFGKHQN